MIRKQTKSIKEKNYLYDKWVIIHIVDENRVIKMKSIEDVAEWIVDTLFAEAE